MIIIEHNSIFSELHIKSICNHMKFRKIFCYEVMMHLSCNVFINEKC